MPETPTAAAALEELTGHEAWAVIRLRESPTVTLVGGSLSRLEKLADIPLEEGVPEDGRRFDRLVAVPFRQVTERGFVAHDDGTPLAVVDIATEREVPLEELRRGAARRAGRRSRTRAGSRPATRTTRAVVERIIRDEIGNGEGANLVVGRHYRAQLSDWDADRALTVLRRLLTSERGAYWTYCFWTGDRFLIGASPERHVSVHGGDVRMNPISGTFRLRGLEPTERKQRLLEFLADEKEIFELFMVVDEELKMMCDICHEGGQVLGPFLKPMTHLVHTEYLLAGRTRSDVRDVLRDTMFAATVTGAPVENACRLIHEYESEGRGYYAGALALIGRDEQGAPTADSPIVIRTADVSPDGAMKVTAGATLVRDSEARVRGGRDAGQGRRHPLGVRAGAGSDGYADRDRRPHPGRGRADRPELAQPAAREVLAHRPGRRPAGADAGRQDDRDRARRGRLREHAGARVLRARHGLARRTPRGAAGRRRALFDDVDLVVVGPGPGDPREHDHPKIAAYRKAIDALLDSGKPFLAVCLGHQVLCDRLGIPLAYKDIVFQGTQSAVQIDGRAERVGFYNTFVAARGRHDSPGRGEGREPTRRPATSTWSPGRHFRGVQFHAESILTENGFALLRGLLLELSSG